LSSVSIIVPCRNEALHIDAFCESLRAQQLDACQIVDVIVADGMSNDGTRERLADWQSLWKSLRVIDNHRHIVSAGLNLAIARARGEFVIRMDVHTMYDPTYVSECVRVLRETGANCVGGAWRPLEESGLQQAIALAFKSPFGSGGALSRRADYSGPVDTVYLGAWRRDELVRLGGFDESLVRNQDDELNLRIARSGGVIWQSSRIRSSYAPRASLRALFFQFYQYGYWKVAVIAKHGWPASPRHLAPFGLVAAVALLGLMSPLAYPARIGVSLLIMVYVSAVLVAAWAAGEPRTVLNVARALICMHWGYGVGFARGLIDFLLFRRPPSETNTRLTR